MCRFALCCALWSLLGGPSKIRPHCPQQQLALSWYLSLFFPDFLSLFPLLHFASWNHLQINFHQNPDWGCTSKSNKSLISGGTQSLLRVVQELQGLTSRNLPVRLLSPCSLFCWVSRCHCSELALHCMRLHLVTG